ncbi:hypothetical protein DFJ74DRAFT_695023 [Hyaloraphidium curvatum]|nr:hypothetical protein DFJ74DRAFT_695023 [Hyaloraphidium curvatum]
MQLIVHGHFSRARLWLILLNAPELFPGGGTCLASDAAADPLAGAWMRTPSFRTALRAAMLAARSARELSAEFTPAELGNSMLFFHAGFAACYAAYLMLAVLQRFRAMVSAAPLSDRARALELHSRIVGDVSACLDLLDGSRQPETQAVRVLLRSMLEGDEVRLGRAEVQMLVMARREEAARGCEHAGRGSEGHCWVCAAHRGDEHAGAGGSPLFGSIASASVSSGSKAGRRVRFAEEVEVCETYSAEEYPARSGLHVEEEEREVQELSLGVVLGEWGVTGPAVGPGMPNLLDYR